MKYLIFAAALVAAISAAPTVAAEIKHGAIVTEHLASSILRDTRTGVDPNRLIKVYLPPGYADSGRSYPVVYFCHSLFWSAQQVFADGNMAKMLERGFADGLVKEFILVAADYTSPTIGSVYENTAATGRWLDFTAEELVPFIDRRFRTIRQANSRGLTGDFMGGRGALLLAMRFPQHFSAVYALNPVATGLGLLPMTALPDWQKIHRAKSFADLEGDHISQIFVGFAQAFLPNPSRPPFYCDFPTEMVDGRPQYHADNAQKLRRGFLLDSMIEEYAPNLRKLHGIAFDWGRYDPIQDHVYANQAFTRKLESLGIEHEAEEYRGVPSVDSWTEHGRFYARVLPFFGRHLAFEAK